MTTSTIVWVHGDCLSPHNPALQKAPSAPSIFVWDDALLEEWRISFKRIVFIYECLLELPVIIRRGVVVDILSDFIREHGATHLLTTDSPSPRFHHILRSLSRQMPQLHIEILPIEDFVVYRGKTDLKRFSRYWQAIREHALRS